MSLDLKAIRAFFPALNRKAIFLDNPGGTQIVRHSLDRINRYFLECNANHGGSFQTSYESDALVHDSRRFMAEFLNAASPDEIVYGPNMTTLTFSISRALGRSYFKPGDTIVLTHMDHDGNVSPWLMLAEDHNLKIRFVDFDPKEGTLDLDDLRAALAEKPRLVACGYASNALGTINPVAEITRLAHAAGALVYIDAVQYAPHGPIDVQKLDCDFLVCSAYKFYGPHMGILYGKLDLLKRLVAYKVRPAPSEPPDKFETGTGAFEDMAGLIGTLEYLEWVGNTYGEEQHEAFAKEYSGRSLALKKGMAALSAYEVGLSEAINKAISGLPGVNVYGITDPKRFGERVPTFIFRLPHISPADAAKKLGEQGIYVWDGSFYAIEVTTRLGVIDKGGVIRVGATHYNTFDEIYVLAEALKRL